jgi:hypothetical protein
MFFKLPYYVLEKLGTIYNLDAGLTGAKMMLF